LIAGGEDISLTDFICRLNRSHGIHITGGKDIRFINPIVIGNNQENAMDGDGIRIASGVSDWHILGGRIGNNTAGESGNQKFGVRIERGASSSWTLNSINASGNSLGAVLDNSTGTNRTIFDVRDYTAGANIRPLSFYGERQRLEIGDGNFSLDYKGLDADSVTMSMDAGDYWRYDRVRDQHIWAINSTPLLRLSTAGGGAQLQLTGVNFANLGPAPNGTLLYCPDCVIGNDCAGGGTGAIAKRLNGAWKCN
jgi:hypothetical protein